MRVWHGWRPTRNRFPTMSESEAVPDEIRVLDDRGVNAVLRYHAGSHEVEVLGDHGITRIKFVVQDHPLIDRGTVRIGGRAYDGYADGATDIEMADWCLRVRPAPPVDSYAGSGARRVSSLERPGTSSDDRRELRENATSLISLSRAVAALLTVVGVIGMGTGFLIALETDRTGVHSKLALGVSLAVASAVQVGILLVVTRLAALVAYYVQFRSAE